nr:hypothetical protein 28 [Saccharospirillaceae bacterium]
MTDSTLTPKQSYFLKRLRDAETAGLTIVQLAEQENVSAALLYNYRHVLRQKGHLAPAQPVRSGSSERSHSGFAAVPVSESARSVTSGSTSLIELKTQLANGQPVWMSLPADQLPAALAALSS